MEMVETTSLPRYLARSYRPDCDFLEGRVSSRHAGELLHGRTMVVLLKRLQEIAKESRLEVLLSLRVQVGVERVRVADLVVAQPPFADLHVLRRPPVLCVEVFSSEDRMGRMQERVSEYVAMGVAAVWAVDPWRRVAYVAGEGGRLVVEEALLAVPGTAVRVSVDEVWAELDRLEALAAG